MKFDRLDRMTKGWVVGDFSPAVLQTSAFEVAVKYYQAGDHEPNHKHNIALEITIIAQGRVRMAGRELGAGDIVTIEPGEATDFTALVDSQTVVIKMPSVANDKFPV